jgi:ribosomal protein S18 acetylase RimI-like enzyme
MKWLFGVEGGMKSKFILTITNIKKVAQHHYGNGVTSLPKFFYYSMLNINKFILLGTELDVELPPYHMDAEFSIIKPTLKELADLRRGKDLPREFYYDQIHGVKRCYLALHGDEIAYIHWLYFKGDYSRFLKLSDGVAEFNYNTTLPNFRGRGLMASMMAYILRDLQKEGYEKAVGVVHERNEPAIKSVKKAGLRELQKIKTLGPFNRKIKV